MTTYDKPIDWRRFQESRELAGEWRIVKAKMRHVVDRACRLAERVASDDDAANAIDTLRVFVLDYLDGKPSRVPPIELMRAVGRVLKLEPARTYARAA
ncbi:MAG TPA: hypothetical protein VMJ10_06165 [Kofleriaceae bacterium]|nr:hypothetical protein [Kofleriaceae bacterium]